MNFDIEAAKKEGYSDAEIADYLSKEQNFDLEGAKAEGYTDAELLQYLTSEQDKSAAPDAPITSGFLMGLKDPLTAGAQLLPRAGEFVTSLGYQAPNTLSDWFASEAKRVDEMAKAEEAGYQATRRAEGDSGIDFSRLAGNIINPANVVPGALARGGVVAKSVSTGAFSGAMQPVVGESPFAQEKLQQVATGAVLGPLFESVLKGTGKLASVFNRVTPKGRTEALRDYLNEAAGPQRDIVIKMLQDSKELVTGTRPTAAEVLADVPSAAQLLAIQKKLASEPQIGAQFKAVQESNRVARETLIDAIAKTDAERMAVESARDGVFKNVGAKALDDANMARQELNRIQSEVNTKFANLGKSAGLERTVSKGWGDFVAKTKPKVDEVAKAVDTKKLQQFQLDSLAQNGFFPLKADDIVSPIDRALKGTVSDESRQILSGLREDILSRADKDGIINSNDLYENVRKQINQKIAVYLNKGDQPFQGGIPQSAAKVGANVRSIIDAQLNKSSNNLWGKYLKDYKGYSEKLNRMAVGEALSKKLNTALDKEKAAAFATAVDEATNLIKSSTGLPRYSGLDQILTPAEMKSVNAVRADLARKAKAEDLASGLRTEDVDVSPELPNLLSRPIAFTNIFLKLLANGNTAKVTQASGQLFQNPKALAAFMEAVPKPNIFAKLLARVSPDTHRSLVQALAIRPVENAQYQTINQQGVAPPPAAEQPVSSVNPEELVRQHVMKMKEIDPNLNVDYVMRAYEQASPQEKERLLSMLS